MGLIANLRGPQGLQGIANASLPFVSLAGQVDATGVSDASSVVQSAVNGLPAYGGAIWLPTGQIKLGGITFGGKAVELVGQGGINISEHSGHAPTEILVPDGATGISFGTPDTFQARGPILRKLSFRPAGTTPAAAFALNGGVGSGLLDQVAVSESFATGLRLNGGTAKRTMYFTIRDCQVASKTGLWVSYATGVILEGGVFDANHNLTGVVANTVGAQFDANCDTPTILGTRFSGYATHINSAAPNTFTSGTRHEGFTTAIIYSGNWGTILPGSIQNFSAGGGGTGIQLAAGDRHLVNASVISSVAVRVNYGSATNYTVFDNGALTMPGLPGSDPHIVGQFYKSAGTVKVSAG